MFRVMQSFKKLHQNPILFVPDLFYALVNYILITFIYSYIGFNTISSDLTGDFGSQVEVIGQFISANTTQVLISGITFIAITFFIGAGVYVLRYNLIKQIVHDKKPSLWLAWRTNHEYYYNVILIRIFVYIISILAVAFVILLSTIFYLVINPFNALIATYFSLLIAIIVSIAMILLLKWTLLFRYPLMFLTNKKNPFVVLKNSLRYFKHNPALVIYTWVVILAVLISFMLTGLLLNLIINAISIPITFIAIPLAIILGIAMIIFDLISQLWQAIYLFTILKEKPLKNP